MKEIKEEEIVYNYKYEALDGTVFNSKEECNKYEKTAECVIKKRYNDLVKYTSNECALFNCGSDDYVVDFLKVQTHDDATVIMQMLELSGDNSGKAREFIADALKTNDYLLVGHDSCSEDYYYTYGTRTHVLNKIKKKLFFEVEEQ